LPKRHGRRIILFFLARVISTLFEKNITNINNFIKKIMDLESDEEKPKLMESVHADVCCYEDEEGNFDMKKFI
jgi:hypothetical protein